MTMGASVNATSVNAIPAGFLDFFARNDHQVLPSSPLVPRHDPTLMFTNAGASARPTKRSKFGFASCTPMKHCIVLVIPNLGSGGAERVASLLANYWSAQGNEVTLTTFEKHGTGPFFALDELAAIRWLAASEVATLGRFVCVLRPKEIRQC